MEWSCKNGHYTEDNQGDDVAGDGDAGGNNAPKLFPPAAPLLNHQLVVTPMRREGVMILIEGMTTWRILTPMSQVVIPMTPTGTNQKTLNERVRVSFTRPKPRMGRKW
jgi:hypothetical protein